VNFRAKRIIAPLARALRAGGRLIGIHSHGQDPGLEIIQAVWLGENPFTVSRHELLRAVKYELGSAGRDLNFNAYADNRSIFRYDMGSAAQRGDRLDRNLDGLCSVERRRCMSPRSKTTG